MKPLNTDNADIGQVETLLSSKESADQLMSRKSSAFEADFVNAEDIIVDEVPGLQITTPPHDSTKVQGKRSSIYGMAPEDYDAAVNIASNFRGLACFVRKINEEAGNLLQDEELIDSKAMQTKAKSSNYSCINALVPFNVRLSKCDDKSASKYHEYATKDLQSSLKMKEAIDRLLPILNDQSQWRIENFQSNEILSALKMVLNKQDDDLNLKDQLNQNLLNARAIIENVRITIKVPHFVKHEGLDGQLIYFSQNDSQRNESSPIPIFQDTLPIFAIKANNSDFLFYDYQDKTFKKDDVKSDLIKNAEAQNVEVLAYERYKKDQENKFYAENKPRKITADYDLLSVAFKSIPFDSERTWENAKIALGHTKNILSKLLKTDKKAKNSAIESIARTYVEEITESKGEDFGIGLGITTPDEAAILDQLKTFGINHVNHGAETNNPSPEEFSGQGVILFANGKSSEPIKSDQELVDKMNELRKDGIAVPTNPLWPLHMDRQNGYLVLDQEKNLFNYEEIDKKINKVTDDGRKKAEKELRDSFVKIKKMNLAPPFEFGDVNAWRADASENSINPYLDPKVSDEELKKFASDLSKKCEEIHRQKTKDVIADFNKNLAVFSKKYQGAIPLILDENLNKIKNRELGIAEELTPKASCIPAALSKLSGRKTQTASRLSG